MNLPIDWNPLVRRLCPWLFDPETRQRLPSVQLMLVTLSHVDNSKSFTSLITKSVDVVDSTMASVATKYADAFCAPRAKPTEDTTLTRCLPNQLDAIKQENPSNNNDCDSFGNSACCIGAMHVVRTYDAMSAALPEYAEVDDKVHDSETPPQPRTCKLETRGELKPMLLNALYPRPWSALPFMTPLVEYLVVVSNVEDCLKCSYPHPSFYRNATMRQFVSHCASNPFDAPVQYVVHAWLGARVMSHLHDARMPWSVYRTLGAVIKQMQYAPTSPLKKAAAEYAFVRLQAKLLSLYQHVRFPKEPDAALMMRIIWTPSVRAVLLNCCKSLPGLDAHAFIRTMRSMCAPSSWGMHQLQMELQLHHAQLGWQWGVMIMGLGCANVTSINTIGYNGIVPHVPVQWGDALHGNIRCAAVLHALCECPELLWQRSTINMLMHWVWRCNWRLPCSTSPKEKQPMDALRNILPAMSSVSYTPCSTTLQSARTYHIHAWSDFMCMYYGTYLVQVTDERSFLCDVLTQFRMYCEMQWTRAQMRGILPVWDDPAYLQPFAVDASTYPIKTQPLALSLATHSARALWPCRIGRVGLWHLLQPHGNNGSLAVYAYHPTMSDSNSQPEAKPAHKALALKATPVHVDWSNGCSMSPMFHLYYPRANGVMDYSVRHLAHDHVLLTDLQQWMLLWYCARIMVRDVRLPYDVHQGPTWGEPFWARVCSLLRNGHQPELNVAVVPTRDLVYAAATEVSPWTVVDVVSLQNTLQIHCRNSWNTLSLVVLYGQWWTLEQWHCLMQAVDMACTTQRRRSPDNSPDQRHAVPRVAVRLHILGTMWMSSMDGRIHQAVWPQLYHSHHTNRFQFGQPQLNGSGEPVHAQQRITTQYSQSSRPPFDGELLEDWCKGAHGYNILSAPSRSLLDLFYASYAVQDAMEQWTMPTTGAAFSLHLEQVFQYMHWRLGATTVSVNLHERANDMFHYPPLPVQQPLFEPLAVDDNTLLSSNSAAKGLLSSTVASISSGDSPLSLVSIEDEDLSSDLLLRESPFGQLLSSHEETNASALLSSQSDKSDTLGPDTLLLLPYVPHSGSVTLNVIRDLYPRQEELTNARRLVSDGRASLRLRVWLRRPGVHVLLTHYLSVTAEALGTMTPVCWCHTPYAHQLNCGELYMDSTLPLHQTAAVLETKSMWRCAGTDTLYCSIMPYGKNGQHHFADDKKHRRTLLWMRLCDPMPLFDAMSLAHYERLVVVERAVLYKQCWNVRAALLLPTVLDYTSMAAQHVVLYVMKGTPIQCMWSALQVARVSFSMVSINVRNQDDESIASCITHCRPLRPPNDGLWLECTMDHAIKMRAGRYVPPPITVVNDEEPVQKRKPSALDDLFCARRAAP